MSIHSKKPTVVFLATFPPQECGIATFTQDLSRSFRSLFGEALRAEVAAISPSPSSYQYPSLVKVTIERNNPQSYKEAAKILNKRTDVSLVNIQHEYGIFGGEAGSCILLLLDALTKPVVTTFHTVLPAPSEAIRSVTTAIASKSVRVTVMTERSKQILISEYHIPADKITIIPHGIHASPFTPPESNKRKLGLEGRTVITTFGLLSRNKGIEYAIMALPELVARIPNLTYLIIGATHPEVKKLEGENYRRELEQKVLELGLSGTVRFINQYLKLSEVLAYLSATDVYVAPPLDPNQAVSGTFSYALGAGRPVVSTAFAQAQSDITPDIGRLVEFRKPEQFSEKIAEILSNPELHKTMCRAAFIKTRHQTWENVALSYMKIFANIAPALTTNSASLPPIKLTHLARLTDRFGMFQFADLNQPNPAFGYTADDNARALRVSLEAYRRNQKPSTLRLVNAYIEMLERSFDPKTSTFINYFSADHKPDHSLNSKDNLEDTNGRVLRALLLTSSDHQLPSDFKKRAAALANKRLAAGTNFTHLRALAFLTAGLFARYTQTRDPETQQAITAACDKLVASFAKNSTHDWQWFEPQLTYSNSILSEALLYGYQATKDPRYLTVAERSLEFLISHTFLNNYYVPIGQNGWFLRGSQRAHFDQQPEDTSATVQTLKVMYETTGKDRYRQLMHQAFSWFLGENMLGRFMYDCATGGCYDGLGENSINLNQGAESTISYLLARLAVEGTSSHNHTPTSPTSSKHHAPRLPQYTQ